MIITEERFWGAWPEVAKNFDVPIGGTALRDHHDCCPLVAVARHLGYLLLALEDGVSWWSEDGIYRDDGQAPDAKGAFDWCYAVEAAADGDFPDEVDLDKVEAVRFLLLAHVPESQGGFLAGV